MKLHSNEKLMKALVATALSGVAVAPGDWARPHNEGNTGHVCLCGAVLFATGKTLEQVDEMSSDDILRATARRLGITLGQAISLNNGFEGERIDSADTHNIYNFVPDREWYTIGKAFRRQWQKAES